jgi:hypothetical protein
MDVLPGMRVPMHLDQDEQLILIAVDQELLSTGAQWTEHFLFRSRKRECSRLKKWDEQFQEQRWQKE